MSQVEIPIVASEMREMFIRAKDEVGSILTSASEPCATPVPTPPKGSG